MILFWAIFIAILGCVWPVGGKWDAPGGALGFICPKCSQPAREDQEHLLRSVPRSSLLSGLVILDSKAPTTQLCSFPPDTNLVAGHSNGQCDDSWGVPVSCVWPLALGQLEQTYLQGAECSLPTSPLLPPSSFQRRLSPRMLPSLQRALLNRAGLEAVKKLYVGPPTCD